MEEYNYEDNFLESRYEDMHGYPEDEYEYGYNPYYYDDEGEEYED